MLIERKFHANKKTEQHGTQKRVDKEKSIRNGERFSRRKRKIYDAKIITLQRLKIAFY